MISKYTFFIPARRNSKGLPFKNRSLFSFTINEIPENLRENILVSTDDEYIIDRCVQSGIRFVKRSEETSSDTASTKSVLLEARDQILTDEIVMLYLTYPERSWEDITKAVRFYEENASGSMLCSKELKVSPYLMMYRDGIGGRQIISHDLYRRQDYPECFEISHYIGIFHKNKLDNLNKNLYNTNTVFYPIKEVIDVDEKEDLERYHEKNKHYC